MHRRIKITWTLAVAALVLAMAVATADARRFEFSNQNIRIVWTGFRINALGGLFNITCAMTLEGSFHSRTISKVSGQLIGFITRAALTRPCTGSGEMWLLNGVERPVNTLPWHIRYDRFIGTLPSITRVRVQIIGFALLFTAGGNSCLESSDAMDPFWGWFERNVANEEVTAFTADPVSELTLEALLAGVCPAAVNPEKSGTVTLLGNTTKIRIRLVA